MELARLYSRVTGPQIKELKETKELYEKLTESYKSIKEDYNHAKDEIKENDYLRRELVEVEG
jgi:hypothetical protein